MSWMKAFRAIVLTIITVINTYNRCDARAVEGKVGLMSIMEVNGNSLTAVDSELNPNDVSESDYHYNDSDEDGNSFYYDYDDEDDYYYDNAASNDSPTIEEVDQAKSFRPPDLPLAEISANRTLHLRVPSRDAPEYMLNLYEKFSRNKQVLPKSNIVRSFQNINEDVSNPTLDKGQLEGIDTRVHTLVFNLTSISSDENIDLAKIRLYKLVNKDRRTYLGVDRKVSVFEVFKKNSTSNQFKTHRLISAKHIYGRNSGWESFDVTSAVRRWVTCVNSLQVLEVRIETVFNSFASGDIDIDTKHENKRDPLLVVFSSDAKRRRLHAKELQELIFHEQGVDTSGPETLDVIAGVSDITLGRSSESENSNSLELNQYTLTGESFLHRVKRAKKNKKSKRFNSCRRKPMYVDFSSIGWDDWIIAPTGYQAFECTGRCNFPLSDHLTPTKHAIIQTLMHTANSRKASRACCVPTKLDSMSILYIDQQGNAVFKYKYDGMVVAECGCR